MKSLSRAVLSNRLKSVKLLVYEMFGFEPILIDYASLVSSLSMLLSSDFVTELEPEITIDSVKFEYNSTEDNIRVELNILLNGDRTVRLLIQQIFGRRRTSFIGCNWTYMSELPEYFPNKMAVHCIYHFKNTIVDILNLAYGIKSKLGVSEYLLSQK